MAHMSSLYTMNAFLKGCRVEIQCIFATSPLLQNLSVCRFGCTAFGADRSRTTSTGSSAGGVAVRIPAAAAARQLLSGHIAEPAAIRAQWASTPGISLGSAVRPVSKCRTLLCNTHVTVFYHEAV
jgi:hypothetical protein